MAPVSIYSWWGSEDDWERDWNELKHIRAFESCLNELETIEHDWDKLWRVWDDIGHSIVYWLHLEWVLKASELTLRQIALNLRRIGTFESRLRQIGVDAVKFGLSWVTLEQVMTIRKSSRSKWSRMRRPLWVRHICCVFRKFRGLLDD